MREKGFGKSDLKTDRIVITGPFCAHYEDGELIVEGESLCVEMDFGPHYEEEIKVNYTAKDFNDDMDRIARITRNGNILGKF